MQKALVAGRLDPRGALPGDDANASAFDKSVEVRQIAHKNGARLAVELASDDGADRNDRVGRRQQDRRRRRAEPDGFGEHRACRARASSRGHRENPPSQFFAKGWVRSIDDAAAQNVEAAPKTEGRGPDSEGASRLAVDKTAGGERFHSERRRTRPSAAEATQSSS